MKCEAMEKLENYYLFVISTIFILGIWTPQLLTILFLNFDVDVSAGSEMVLFNSFPASGNSCCLLITFANSLDPDQARQNVWPDLDPNCLTF